MYRFFAWFGFSGKRILSLLLSLFALIMFIINPSLARALAAVAMFFSTGGDFCMSMGDKPDNRGITYMIKGALLFAFAHIIYVFAYCAAANFQWLGFNWGSIVAVCFCLAGLFVMLLLRRNAANLKLWSYCLVYLAVISLNVIVVCSYGVASGGWQLLAMLGVISFFLSDCLIALRTFSKIDFFRSRTARDMVWWLYPIGQLLLIAFIV